MTHIHMWSCFGQRYNECDNKEMLYECTICHKERKVIDKGGVNITT